MKSILEKTIRRNLIEITRPFSIPKVVTGISGPKAPILGITKKRIVPLGVTRI
jgi:hypothetical protein